jgi:hypothetical protein
MLNLTLVRSTILKQSANKLALRISNPQLSHPRVSQQGRKAYISRPRTRPRLVRRRLSIATIIIIPIFPAICACAADHCGCHRGLFAPLFDPSRLGLSVSDLRLDYRGGLRRFRHVLRGKSTQVQDEATEHKKACVLEGSKTARAKRGRKRQTDGAQTTHVNHSPKPSNPLHTPPKHKQTLGKVVQGEPQSKSGA